MRLVLHRHWNKLLDGFRTLDSFEVAESPPINFKTNVRQPLFFYKSSFALFVSFGKYLMIDCYTWAVHVE